MYKVLYMMFFMLLASGCSSSLTLGKFTVLSTNNVANIKYDLDSDKGDYSQYCDRYLFGLSFSSDKKDVDTQVLSSLADNLLDENKDNGDLLVNVKIKDTKFTFFPYSSSCIEMHGDVVKVK